MPAKPTPFLIAIALFLLQSPMLAQTNTTLDFQGFHPGDMVQVRVIKQPIILGQALFQAQTSSNIAVVSKGERYVLDKSSVSLSAPQNLPQVAATPILPTQPSAEPALGGNNVQSLIAAVQKQILGPHSGKEGFPKATKAYQENVKGYLDGRITLADIVAQAEQTLETIDKYQPERAQDPQYEGQISYLRDFVKRARNGETVESPGKVE
jgi:hypothetical protein